MASKYAGLPDIDSSNPDVYETPDVPTSFSFGHDSDSESEYLNEHGLNTSGSSSNLLNAARQANADAAAAKGSSSVDEAIDKTRLKPADARNRFVNVNGKSLSNGSHSSRPGSSLLPESSTYSVRNIATTSKHRLSSTTLRQLRHQHALQNGEEAEEQETPTERLRRLRYETQELEQQLEQEALLKKQQRQTTGLQGQNNDVEEETEYETEEEVNLPLRDDADKTRPPPHRRRRKKKQVDSNGELSPALLLQQLKRLRGNLDSIQQQNQNTREAYSSEENREGQAKDLLERLANGHGQEREMPTRDVAAEQQQIPEASTSKLRAAPDAYRFDSRLATLEEFIGAREADDDESRPLPPPLLSTLARLEHQLQLLTQPRHLDTISRRVKTLVTDLERVHEARRKIGDTRPLNVALSSGITISTGPPGTLPAPSSGGSAQSQMGSSSETILPPDALQKIDGLFTILSRIEPLLPLTPQLLARLRSLASLHESAGTFTADLQENEQAVTGLKQSEIMLEQLLSSLKDSLSANEELTKRNLESLETRLEHVTQRLQSM